MAKRKHPRKRRDRKMGESPYFRYKKREFRYSGEYYAWFYRVSGKAKRGADMREVQREAGQLRRAA